MPASDDTPNDSGAPTNENRIPSARPGRHSRKNSRADGGSRKTKLLVGSIVAIAVALVVSAVVLAVHPAAKVVPKSVPAAPAAPVVSNANKATCPLTGTPAPGGTVPDRPALGVKVDDVPQARPQSGLDNADMVFEEPVEGGITRFVAIFQCQESSVVGPIRSARAIDKDILSQLSDPILAHVGGINPVIALLRAAPLIDRSSFGYPSAYHTISGRVAPYSTFASTSALWGTDPKDVSPPAPLFTFSAAVPSGTPGWVATVPFSSSADVTWTYDPKTEHYLRSYGSMPAKLMDGVQISAANVVIQSVHLTYGPWVENSEGALEVQADLVSSGPVVVLRNGVTIKGTWSRTSLTGPTVLTATDGATIALQPGSTWVELLSNKISATTGPLPTK